MHREHLYPRIYRMHGCAKIHIVQDNVVKLYGYRIAGYLRGVYISRISREHSQSSKRKIIYVEEARFSISIREITFREQQLFAKYKHLENNPLYGISNYSTKSHTYSMV